MCLGWFCFELTEVMDCGLIASIGSRGWGSKFFLVEKVLNPTITLLVLEGFRVNVPGLDLFCADWGDGEME